MAPIDGTSVVRLGDRVGWLIPFIEGVPANPACDADREAAARGLGRLHAVGERIAVRRRPRLRALAALEWPAPRTVPELGAWAATIAETRAWAIAFVQSVARERELPVSVVHGDYFPGNVLVSGGRIAHPGEADPRSPACAHRSAGALGSPAPQPPVPGAARPRSTAVR